MNELLLLLTDLEIFGADLIDKKDFFELLVKAVFNFLVIGYIIRYLYYPATKNKDYLFTYLLISVTVFCLCFLLENVKLELGFALGLFAIFGSHCVWCFHRLTRDTLPLLWMGFEYLY